MFLQNVFIFLSFIFSQSIFSMDFENYLDKFDYQERKNMKIQSHELLELYKKNEVQIVDIRFKEEFKLWHFDGSINIPINELPKRLNELRKDKLIVTVCPHLDRATIARLFLTLKGFNAKYLSEGLIKLFENSRGDVAKEIFNKRLTK